MKKKLKPVGEVTKFGGVEWFQPLEEGTLLFVGEWTQEDIDAGKEKAAQISAALDPEEPFKKIAIEIGNKLIDLELTGQWELDVVNRIVPEIEKLLYKLNTEAVYAAARELNKKMDNQ